MIEVSMSSWEMIPYQLPGDDSTLNEFMVDDCTSHELPGYDFPLIVLRVHKRSTFGLKKRTCIATGEDSRRMTSKRIVCSLLVPKRRCTLPRPFTIVFSPLISNSEKSASIFPVLYSFPELEKPKVDHLSEQNMHKLMGSHENALPSYFKII